MGYYGKATVVRAKWCTYLPVSLEHDLITLMYHDRHPGRAGEDPDFFNRDEITLYVNVTQERHLHRWAISDEAPQEPEVSEEAPQPSKDIASDKVSRPVSSFRRNRSGTKRVLARDVPEPDSASDSPSADATVTKPVEPTIAANASKKILGAEAQVQSSILRKMNKKARDSAKGIRDNREKHSSSSETQTESLESPAEDAVVHTPEIAQVTKDDSGVMLWMILGLIAFIVCIGFVCVYVKRCLQPVKKGPFGLW